MKKTILTLSFASIMATSSNALAIQELTGDTKLACEAILCLSTGTRPAECAPSIARYFGISYKYWSDTIKGRRNFLNLCPTGSQEDKQLDILKNQVLANMETDCTVKYLNTRIETKVFEITGDKNKMPQNAKKIYCEDENDGNGNSSYIYNYRYYKNILKREPQCKWEETRFRINPNLPKYCKDLIDHSYTDKNLKYTCDGEFKPQNLLKKDCWVE